MRDPFSLPDGIEQPYSCDAEQAVLGGLMLDNDRWDEIVPLIHADDFFLPAHRRIYGAVATMFAANLPVDVLTLSEILEQKEQLKQVGGFAYLAELGKNTPSTANIVAYAEIVQAKSRLRQLIMLGNEMSDQASHPRADFTDITEMAEQRLYTLSEQKAVRQDISLKEGLGLLIEKLEQANGGNGITGTPTGFSELDTKTCGLQPGDLILLAGRPSMGKTALALAFCLSALESAPDAVAQIFSLEMPMDQLLMRMVSMLERVPHERLRSGLMDDEDWARVSRAMETLIQWENRLIIDDSSYQTPALLRARARRNVRKYGRPSLIMVDYLQLIRSPEQENRTQEIAEISRSLKALGKELGCPVLALSQLNRQLEQRADKRPNNGDLRESGALEQDADLILFVYRDEVYDANTSDIGVAEIIIGKHRQGSIGTVKIQFDGACTRFSDLTEKYYDLGAERGNI
ncbi:replicative DNA helicase [Photorhabdus laumondii subsp. laumondii]|uniref:SPI-7-type island replicative DNA helicase n=1 Tax=Photorhabdus laumondii TaxID=2218628 RepID=UPI0007337404|nr:SPI-7-type island replicative DNA helicase [Photorhabdus laumondii]KTL60202.1 replicative DNA helicase [Photorhabdus laumondii subsp. laumondii]